MKRFTDNGDGTVTDTLTGLMWTKATVATGKTHKQAIAAAKKLDVAGHKDWRMPTVEELFLLADRSLLEIAEARRGTGATLRTQLKAMRYRTVATMTIVFDNPVVQGATYSTLSAF